jgi:hypothetical protein
MTESTNIEQTKTGHLLNIKEEEEQQDENQSSTSCSNLNKSIDNLGPDVLKSNLDFTEKSHDQFKRKLSAPNTVSQNISLHFTKMKNDPRGSYFNKLMCKGLFF